MATLIPQVQVTDFQKLTVEQIRRLKCCEVYDGEDYLFSFTNPKTDYIRLKTEYLGQLSNSVGGEDLEQITGKSETKIPTVEKKEKRTYKKHKHREKKKVISGSN
jgi:hypothetical protein